MTTTDTMLHLFSKTVVAVYQDQGDAGLLRLETADWSIQLEKGILQVIRKGSPKISAMLNMATAVPENLREFVVGGVNTVVAEIVDEIPRMMMDVRWVELRKPSGTPVRFRGLDADE